MSIPKVIHYCWFGRNEKSDLIKKCIASWRKYCPDWEIIEWNEDNIDIDCCSYVRRAYDQKRWGFVTDPIRFKIIYEHGGVYMDADAELIAPIDQYLKHKAFFGYSTETEIGTGLGFGAEAGNSFIKKLMDHYFNLDESSKFIVSSKMETPIFIQEYPEFYADKSRRQDQIIGDDILIIWNIWKFEVHHYTGSWQSPVQRLFNRIPFLPEFFFSLRKKIKKFSEDVRWKNL